MRLACGEGGNLRRCGVRLAKIEIVHLLVFVPAVVQGVSDVFQRLPVVTGLELDTDALATVHDGAAHFGADTHEWRENLFARIAPQRRAAVAHTPHPPRGGVCCLSLSSALPR